MCLVLVGCGSKGVDEDKKDVKPVLAPDSNAKENVKTEVGDKSTGSDIKESKDSDVKEEIAEKKEKSSLLFMAGLFDIWKEEV